MMKQVFLVLILTLSLASPVVSALDKESTHYEQSHQGADFPVGWNDYSSGGPFPQWHYDWRMAYPAMNGGEGDEMAGNGPFPYVVFFGSDGESVDGYNGIANRLVQRGYIVLVTEDVSNFDDYPKILSHLYDLHLHMQYLNSTTHVVMGTVGNIQWTNWVLGGHGFGGASAFESYPYWSSKTDDYGPMGVFGLAPNFDGIARASNSYSSSQRSTAMTNSSLFIAGTVDEVADSSQALTRISTSEFAYQFTHLLGGNHYQFQDTTSIFENDDGEATISQTEQLNYAADKLTAYLDLTLRSDYTRFSAAYSRAADQITIDDPSAYVEEDLLAADFVHLSNKLVEPQNHSTLYPEDNLSLSADWALRNLTPGAGISLGETNVLVQCGIDGANWIPGALDENNTANCLFDLDDVTPGQRKAVLQVLIEGAPTSFAADFYLVDTPIDFVSPLPQIAVPQRSSVTTDVASFATDPDGLDVVVNQANITCQDEGRMSVEISADELSFTVSDNSLDEWTGSCSLSLTLATDSDQSESAQVELQVFIQAVDDPVEQYQPVPNFSYAEDSGSHVIDMSYYVRDPEGEDIFATFAGQTNGEEGPISYSFAGPVLTLTTLDDQFGSLDFDIQVGDGTTDPINVILAIQITPVDDPMLVNSSRWNLEMVEDIDEEFNLSEFAYDVDGDVLNFTVGFSNDVGCSVEVVGDKLVVELNTHWNGLCDSWSLSVTSSDESFTLGLNISVEATPDISHLSNLDVEIEANQMASVKFDFQDWDRPDNWFVRLKVDQIIVIFEYTCIEDVEKAKHSCIGLVNLPETHDGTVSFEIGVTDQGVWMGLSQVVEVSQVPDNNQDDDDDVAGATISTDMLLAGFILFSLIGIGAAFVVKNGREKELDEEEISGGLLARAEKLQ